MSRVRGWAMPVRRRGDGMIDLRLGAPWRASIAERAALAVAALDASAPGSLLEPGEEAALDQALADIGASAAVRDARIADLRVVIDSAYAKLLDPAQAAAWLRALNGLRHSRGGPVVRGLPADVAPAGDPRRVEDPDWAVLDALAAAFLSALSD